MLDPLKTVWREHDQPIPCEEVFPGCFVAQTEPMTLEEACRLYFEPSKLFSKPLIPKAKERKPMLVTNRQEICDAILALTEPWLTDGSFIFDTPVKLSEPIFSASLHHVGLEIDGVGACGELISLSDKSRLSLADLPVEDLAEVHRALADALRVEQQRRFDRLVVQMDGREHLGSKVTMSFDQSDEYEDGESSEVRLTFRLDEHGVASLLIEQVLRDRVVNARQWESHELRYAFFGE